MPVIISPTDLLELAKQIPDPVPYVPLHEYGETIFVMYHKKNMTFRQIMEWFSERGLDYNMNYFRAAMQKWMGANQMQVAAMNQGSV